MKLFTSKNMIAAAAALIFCGCASSEAIQNKADKTMDNRIKIGWASRSIASDKAVPITGQFHLRISQGIYTPVLASAMVMENNGDAVIFVSVDAVSLRPEALKKVKALLADEIKGFPVDKIIINSTHTHAGPSTNEIPSNYPNKLDFVDAEEMRTYIARQIADAIKEAWLNRAEGSVTYGYGFATTGHSRRTIYLDDISKREAARPGIALNGHGKMYGKTNDDMFDGYEAGTDSFINIFYTFDKDGKLSGAVINVPCPSQTGEHAWMLHASFWHNVREKLTAKYGNIGIVCQAAAAGDLSPRQLHYLEAEKRRYRLKYADKIAEYMKNPMIYPKMWIKDDEMAKKQYENDALEWMRAEDIASRIAAAFDEVLSWAKLEKQENPELKHEVRTLKLSRRMFPQELLDEEKRNHEILMKEEFATDGEPFEMLYKNSRLASRRNRIVGVAKRAEMQEKEPYITTDIHVVKIGNMAFASNRFELYMDYMHRIQARSPFEQTFIVQLVTDENGVGSYLATEKGWANKGYSATPYCNQVSPQGGQELVNETLKVLKEIR